MERVGEDERQGGTVCGGSEGGRKGGKPGGMKLQGVGSKGKAKRSMKEDV